MRTAECQMPVGLLGNAGKEGKSQRDMYYGNKEVANWNGAYAHVHGIDVITRHLILVRELVGWSHWKMSG